MSKNDETIKAKYGLKRNSKERLQSATSLRSSADPVDSIVDGLLKGRIRNVVVLAGAGISTDSGIPDFRSPGTGLYSNLSRYGLPYPEAVFEIDYFTKNPKPFFTLAREIYPRGLYHPNFIHYFLRQLHNKGCLLKIYTQNIDGLERLTGVPEHKLLEAHGSFITASCVVCKQQHSSDAVRTTIMNSKIPVCSKLHCNGLVKPDIVFFGEDLPRSFYRNRFDLIRTDLLLVLGTSLEVEPFASMVDRVHGFVPRILFNRTCVGPFCKRSRRRNDILMLGNIGEELRLFTDKLNWTKEIDAMCYESSADANKLDTTKALNDSEEQSTVSNQMSSEAIVDATVKKLQQLSVSNKNLHQSNKSQKPSTYNRRNVSAAPTKTAERFLKHTSGVADKRPKPTQTLPSLIAVDKYSGRSSTLLGNRFRSPLVNTRRDQLSSSSVDTSQSSYSDSSS